MAKALLRLFCNLNCIHLCPHITLSSESNVNIVEWLVSMPAVHIGVREGILLGGGAEKICPENNNLP